MLLLERLAALLELALDGPGLLALLGGELDLLERGQPLPLLDHRSLRCVLAAGLPVVSELGVVGALIVADLGSGEHVVTGGFALAITLLGGPISLARTLLVGTLLAALLARWSGVIGGRNRRRQRDQSGEEARSKQQGRRCEAGGSGVHDRCGSLGMPPEAHAAQRATSLSMIAPRAARDIKT